MKYLFALIITLITNNIYCQDLTGKVYNSETEKPISYVNIGILGKNIGTVSDINGNFGLILIPNNSNDSLRISCIGFQPKTYLISDLVNSSANKTSVDIYLKPITYDINEVIIKGLEPKLRTLGNPIRDNNNIRIQTDSLLGSEIGLTIRVPKRNKYYKLKNFKINLTEIESDTEVRLNVYNLVDTKPSEIILQKPIFITIPKGADILTLELSEYDIIVDNDFFISIENFKGIPSEDKRLKFNGVYGLGNTETYFRKVSQGDWEKIPLVSIQFEILAFEYSK